MARRLAWGAELWFYFFDLGSDMIKGVGRRVECKILHSKDLNCGRKRCWARHRNFCEKKKSVLNVKARCSSV